MILRVNNAPPAAATKLIKVCDRFRHLAFELKRGECFPVTRLTCLKAVCADHKAAARFARYLVNLAGRSSRMQGLISPQERRLLSLSRKMLAVCRPTRRRAIESPLWGLLRQLEEFQNEYKKSLWGSVRLIKSKRLLVVEETLRCILFPHEAAFWAYQAAKDYAERYDSRSPFGLVRASAPSIMDMARFWRREAKRSQNAERRTERRSDFGE